MNYKMVGRFLAQILTVEGLFMIPAVIIGYVCGEDNAMQAPVSYTHLDVYKRQR